MLMNSYSQRELPSVPEHPNIVTAVVPPQPACWPLPCFREETVGTLCYSLCTTVCQRLWAAGGGGRAAVPVLGYAASAVGLQPHLPDGSLPAPLKTTPKPLWGLGQHSSGATVRHPITCRRWDRVPCASLSPPMRWDEGIVVLSLAGVWH